MCCWHRRATAVEEVRALPALGRRFPCRRHAHPRGTRFEVRINQLPNGSRRDPLQRGSCPRLLRPRVRRAFLAHTRAVRAACSVDFRTSFISKCSPVGFLLGKFRSRGDAVFGRKRAAVHAERCRPQHAGGSQLDAYRTNVRAPVSGLVDKASTTQPSIPMPRRRRMASRRLPFVRLMPSGTRISANTICPTTPYARPTIQSER